MTGEAPQTPDENAMDDAVISLLSRVGRKVRQARNEKRIPRRVLSEKSGVSPRYLAQLEAGEGNISIALLLRVAHALEQNIEWFIGQDDPLSGELRSLISLYLAADTETREHVMGTLAPAPSNSRRAGRVALIGLRGAGKTTLGRKLSEQTGVPFVELNKEIEKAAGMPVGEIMALYGQEGYRKLEADALDTVIRYCPSVILAAGGGIVGETRTFGALLACFNTIWIKANPKEHMDRVREQGDERPMAGNPAAMEQLRAILTSREQFYERAQATVDTSNRPVNQSADDLLKLVEIRKFLIPA